MARPTKYTKKIGDAVVAALRNGNTRRHAAQLAHVTDRTLRNWFATGSTSTAPADLAAFVERAEEAEALAAQDAVDTIREARFDDWKAAAWYLARRFPDEWGDKAKRTAKEAIEEILDVVQQTLGKEDADRVYDALVTRGRRTAAEAAQSRSADDGGRQLH